MATILEKWTHLTTLEEVMVARGGHVLVFVIYGRMIERTSIFYLHDFKKKAERRASRGTCNSKAMCGSVLPHEDERRRNGDNNKEKC